MQQFNECDADHDGRISFKEFHAMLAKQGYAEDEVKNLFPEADTDQDGFLDFAEFRRYLNFQDQKEEIEEIYWHLS